MNKSESVVLISNRILELHSEIDKFKNTISINRNHIRHAKRRIVILEKGLKFMNNGRWGKAEAVFKKEIDLHFN